MTEDEFMTLPFAQAAVGHAKSVVQTIAFGFDTRGTGALIKLLRENAEPASYFIPSPVAVEFGRNCNDIGNKLGYNGFDIPDVPLLDPADWNNDKTEMVVGIRVEYFPTVVILGLHLGGGRGVFHRLPANLAKALADTFLDEHDRGRLIDLRSSETGSRPQ